MKAPMLGVSSIFVALLVISCGGTAEQDEAEPTGVLFDPARGPELALTALPGLNDLPGTGWSNCPVVTDCPEVGGESMSSIIADLPSCSALAPATRGVIEGSDLDWAPAGYAAVDFSRFSTSGAPVPQAVAVEIRISNTLAEVEDRWVLTQEFFTSEDGRNCYADGLNGAFATVAEDNEDPAEVTVVPAASSAPHHGIAFALATLAILDGEKTGVMNIEMYRWPYSNASVTVVIAGNPGDLSGEFVDRVLRAVDRAVVEAGQDGASDDDAGQLATRRR